MLEKNKVRVVIHGKTVTLMGKETEEYLKRVAEYIDDKMRELRKSNPQVITDVELYHVLTSINVADDYFKELEKNVMLEEEIHRVRLESQSKCSKLEFEKLTREFQDLKLKCSVFSEEIEKYKKEKAGLEKINKSLEESLLKYNKTLNHIKNPQNKSVKSAQNETVKSPQNEMIKSPQKETIKSPPNIETQKPPEAAPVPVKTERYKSARKKKRRYQ